MAETVHAELKINRASDMTDAGRKQIADWLRKHADDLVKDGPQYAPHFRGRYFSTSR